MKRSTVWSYLCEAIIGCHLPYYVLYVGYDLTPLIKSAENQSAQMSKITNDGLTLAEDVYSCVHMATVDWTS